MAITPKMRLSVTTGSTGSPQEGSKLTRISTDTSVIVG